MAASAQLPRTMLCAMFACAEACSAAACTTQAALLLCRAALRERPMIMMVSAVGAKGTVAKSPLAKRLSIAVTGGKSYAAVMGKSKLV